MTNLIEVDFSQLELLVSEALKDASKTRLLGSITGRIVRHEPTMWLK